jgi:DNA-binding beta-propeller fold protein YncE/peroxiredoxin
MRLGKTAFLASVALAGVTFLVCCKTEAKEMPASPFAHRQKVAPLPEGTKWLNTAGPLELKDLRGKFVLIDFWTYCCINCMHILPELNRLEHAYPKNLVVVGVHSAKFATEQESDNIAEAIQRYKIEHPVINDANHAVWEQFGVEAWPTVLLVDPEGYAVWGASGEITFDQVDKVLRAALPYYREKGLLDESPVRFGLLSARAQPTPLRFPGKIVADEGHDRLYIADSNHNRIVVARLDGTLVDVIGCGAAGKADGDFAAAEFNEPQGMALAGGVLYVADTENHLIRAVHLDSRKVATVAGTGRQAREPASPTQHGNPRTTPLTSPWDLCIHGDDLFIAMAGCHQIWKMRLDGTAIGPYAGNGREDIVDGPLLGRQPYQAGFASFAQPSGLATDGQWLYVADSEGSSIRDVPFDPRKEVRTVVGTSALPVARLFTFGDIDGPASRVRLQHPLGLACRAGQLYVADTYNHKIKVVDPASGTTRTIAGTGKPGHSDADPAAFYEPGGLAAAGGKLLVADTNNHAIRVIDLATRKVSTLTIAGLRPPAPPAAAAKPLVAVIEEKLAPVAVRPREGAVRLDVRLELPPGYKINPLAPMAYRLEAAAGQPPVGPLRRDGFGRSVRLEKPAGHFEIRVPTSANGGRDTLRVVLDYYYCREGSEGLCRFGTVAWTVPLELSAAADRDVVNLSHKAP